MRIIIKSINIIIRLAAIAVVLVASSACTVMKPGTDYPFQGKVWRGDVTRQFLRAPTPLQDAEDAKAGLPQTFGRRFTIVRVLDGEFFKDLVIGNYLVPDNIEYADLEKGAIVDVISQKGTDIDYTKYKVNRVIRLVCAGHDTECIKRERAASRVNTVIDPNPDGGFMNGNTYVRKVSAAEKEKYD